MVLGVIVSYHLCGILVQRDLRPFRDCSEWAVSNQGPLVPGEWNSDILGRSTKCLCVLK